MRGPFEIELADAEVTTVCASLLVVAEIHRRDGLHDAAREYEHLSDRIKKDAAVQHTLNEFVDKITGQV